MDAVNPFVFKSVEIKVYRTSIGKVNLKFKKIALGIGEEILFWLLNIALRLRSG